MFTSQGDRHYATSTTALMMRIIIFSDVHGRIHSSS